jgi:outer membrane protein OmpA-like peptidoglycan-associated protein
MRASFLIVTGMALALAAPAFAGPAYTTDKAVDFLLQSKQNKLGASRGLHPIDEPASAQPQTQPKTFDLMVNFEFDSDRLTPAAQANLDQFAAALLNPQVVQSLKDEKLAIDGFTDASGTEMYNNRLSERRAEAVVKYLAQKGVSREALVAKGFGPAKPRAQNPFDPINRRVETHLVD